MPDKIKLQTLLLLYSSRFCHSRAGGNDSSVGRVSVAELFQ
jgi:hypothetical protein